MIITTIIVITITDLLLRLILFTTTTTTENNNNNHLLLLILITTNLFFMIIIVIIPIVTIIILTITNTDTQWALNGDTRWAPIELDQNAMQSTMKKRLEVSQRASGPSTESTTSTAHSPGYDNSDATEIENRKEEGTRRMRRAPAWQNDYVLGEN